MVMKQQYEDEIVRLRRQLGSHPLKGDPDSRGGGRVSGAKLLVLEVHIYVDRAALEWRLQKRRR